LFFEFLNVFDFVYEIWGLVKARDNSETKYQTQTESSNRITALDVARAARIKF